MAVLQDKEKLSGSSTPDATDLFDDVIIIPEEQVTNRKVGGLGFISRLVANFRNRKKQSPYLGASISPGPDELPSDDGRKASMESLALDEPSLLQRTNAASATSAATATGLCALQMRRPALYDEFWAPEARCSTK